MDRITLPVFFVTLLSLASPSASFASNATVSTDARLDREALGRIVRRPHKDLCSPDAHGFRCLAKVVTDDTGAVVMGSTPVGFGPTDIQSAYKLPTSGGDGKLVAVVDVGDYPNAEADLAVYRAHYGLSPCTSANGCFQKVDENGGQNYPNAMACSSGSFEPALDIEMVSAACPDCRIMLVEPNSYATADLGAAINTAIDAGAVAISNSYGGPEWGADEAEEEPIYTHPGVLITASSGDEGYGVAYPAASAGVLAVGATTLSKSSSSRGWAEEAWDKSGSGCSAYIKKPSYESSTGCSNRMTTDLSALGDPDTGVAVYCTDPGNPTSFAWELYGGTSVSSPLVAAMFTLLHVSPDPSYVWSHTSNFFDVTEGSNGSCSVASWCNAGVGYDGPTGWGTPNGTLLLGGSGTGDAGASDAAEQSDAGHAVVDASGPGSNADAATPQDASGGHDGADAANHPDSGGLDPVGPSVGDAGGRDAETDGADASVTTENDAGESEAPAHGGSSGCAVSRVEDGGGAWSLFGILVALMSVRAFLRRGIDSRA